MKTNTQHTNLFFIAWNQTNATGFLCGEKSGTDWD